MGRAGTVRVYWPCSPSLLGVMSKSSGERFSTKEWNSSISACFSSFSTAAKSGIEAVWRTDLGPDGRARANSQGDRVRGARVQVVALARGVRELDLREEGGPGDGRDPHAFDLGVQGLDDVGEKIVRQGAVLGGLAHAHADGRGLDVADADGQLGLALAGEGFFGLEHDKGPGAAGTHDHRFDFHPS